MVIFYFHTVCDFIGFYHILSLNQWSCKLKDPNCLHIPHISDHLAIFASSFLLFWFWRASSEECSSPSKCHLFVLTVSSRKNFVISVNFITSLFTPLFWVLILEKLGPNADPWRTWSNFFIVKTNQLFLRFVPYSWVHRKNFLRMLCQLLLCQSLYFQRPSETLVRSHRNPLEICVYFVSWTTCQYDCQQFWTV